MTFNKGESPALAYAFSIACALAGIVCVMATVRYANKVTASITVSKPVEGVACATMVTGDGAAISCWKDDLRQMSTSRLNNGNE